MRKAVYALAFLAFAICSRAQVELHALSPRRAVDVLADTSLRWSVKTTNLLVNGGFEAGTNGWILPRTASIDHPRTSYEGTNELRIYSGTVAQDIVLPSTTSPIIWSFEMWTYEGRFTAEVQTLTGQVLKHEDFSHQGVPTTDYESPNWWFGNIDLSEFAGQQVRLAINCLAAGSPLHFLDAVRVDVFPEGIEFDVYGEYFNPGLYLKPLGRARGGSWPLNGLEPNRTFYWRVDAILNGATNAGPVMSFRTRNSGYGRKLEFASLPKLVCPNQPLPIELFFRDTNGFAVSASLESIAAAADNAPSPPVVITEVNVSLNAEIEFMNISDRTIDLTRWFVQLQRGGYFRIPSGATLAPGQIFTLRSFETNSVWPHLR
ncbi:MAG TPA: lamin tail domain-containing protein, partial [Verrucomicrobiae bacterium]|nr:lamin tail domain-containing protein [Verrucomicrobiae bacterium]